MPHPFDPLIVRGITIPNRIVVSPMCEYSSENGFANDWHLVHLGSRAVGGAGLIFTEATAVTPEGRISPEDLGIWSDDHIEFLARIVRFLKDQGAVPGMQLAHAGRKGSTHRPWSGTGAIPLNAGGWVPVAPSAIAYSETYPMPRALSKDEIAGVVEAFAARSPPRARGRFSRPRDSRRPWIPNPRILFAAKQSAQRRIRRLIRKSHAPGPRNRLRHSQANARTTSALHSHLRHRLERRRLGRGSIRRAGKTASPTRRRCRGLLFRRASPRPENRSRPWLPGSIRGAHSPRSKSEDRSRRLDRNEGASSGNSGQRKSRPGFHGEGIPARPLLAATRRPRTEATDELARAIPARRAPKFA